MVDKLWITGFREERPRGEFFHCFLNLSSSKFYLGLIKYFCEVSPRGMIYHHIYNRGAHKAPIFKDGSDYWRMLKLLYIANCSQPFNINNIGGENIFEIARKDTLVNIVAYCLMPNHIHIAISSMSDLESDPGIVKFMRKLCTGYSMYFNKKYEHSGTIWQGPYKEKIANDNLDYIRQLISYIHLNPYAIKEPEMSKEVRKEHPEEAWSYSMQYEFSSLKDYLREERPRVQTSILSTEELSKWR